MSIINKFNVNAKKVKKIDEQVRQLSREIQVQLNNDKQNKQIEEKNKKSRLITNLYDQKIEQYSEEASKQEIMENSCIEQIVARQLLHQIELLILTTDQAYFHKIGFTRTIHFLQYYTSQQSIKPMKKILHTQSNRKLKPMPTLPILFHGLDNQSWTYQPRKLEFVISLSQFSLIPLNIYCRNNQLQFKGRFLYPNGRPLSIPAEYKDQFLSRANKNANKIRFFTQQDRNQLLLQSNIFFDSNCSAEQKIYECLQYIENSQIDFENALQMLNLSRKNNLFSYKMIRKQLQVKNKLSKLLFENKSTEELGTIHDFKEQNSSVSSVFSITDTQSSSNQQKIVKNGGFFQVSKKTSLITDQNGATEQKDLAQKTPIPTLKSYKGLIQQKMKRQIKLVKEVLYDKYLLKYYTTETQPTTIYMDFASGTLKDAIYCNRLSFTQLLNLSEQLIEAMSILHKSKIVHRDLKPENILISGSSLKIIDFCESVKTDDVFQQNHFLGSTLPYSAIQCILGRAEGFNKRQIDLWSVAMILYEITFKSIPMYYQRFVGNEIVQKWRQGTQFSISPLYRRHKGLRLIEQVISLVCIRGLKVKPQQRLSLKTYSELLSSIKSFQEMMREDV